MSVLDSTYSIIKIMGNALSTKNQTSTDLTEKGS